MCGYKKNKGTYCEITEKLKHIFLIWTFECRSRKKDPETGKNTIQTVQ